MVDAWCSALVRRRRRCRLSAPNAVVGSLVRPHPLADRGSARTERPRGCGARLVGGGGIPTHGPLLAAAEHYGVPAGDGSGARPSLAALGSAVLAAALW